MTIYNALMKVLLLTSLLLAGLPGITSAQTVPQNQVTDQHAGAVSPAAAKSLSGTADPAAARAKAGTKTQSTEKDAHPAAIPPAASVADRSREYTSALREVLNLTDDQTKKITDVNTVLIQQIDKLSRSSRNSADFQQGLLDADRARVEGYNKILTQKQFKVYSSTPQLSGLTAAAVVRADQVKPDSPVTENGFKGQNQPVPASK